MTVVNLKARILIPSVLATAFALAAFVAATYHEEKEHIAGEFTRSIQAIQGHYQSDMEERSRKLAAIIEVLLHDKAIRAALKTRDRDALLAQSLPVFQQLQAGHSVTHFYFHDPRRINLLRVHQPERWGDVIERFTALAAERTGREAHGIELGPLGTFTLRVVAPVREGNRLLGYIELGEEIDYLVNDMRSVFNVSLFVVLEKRYLNQDAWREGNDMLGRKQDWERFPKVVLASQTLASPPPRSTRFCPAALARFPTAASSWNGTAAIIWPAPCHCGMQADARWGSWPYCRT